jgi:hypothetical protein
MLFEILVEVDPGLRVDGHEKRGHDVEFVGLGERVESAGFGGVHTVLAHFGRFIIWKKLGKSPLNSQYQPELCP